MKLKSSLLIALISSPNLSHAALGPIVITPTRTEQTENTSSATVYIINQQAIENSGANTSVDLIRGIPGVQIDDLFGNGTEVSLSVRGFSGTSNANTLILIDGRRMNHSDTATPDIHQIAPKDIQRIEVLVGSAGVLYGDQAVGGVINIITKTAISEYQEVISKFGSFNYKGIEFNAAKQLSKQVSGRLSIGHFKTDNYRENNQQDNTNLSGFIQYKDDSQRVFLSTRSVDDGLELPGALLEAEFNDDPRQSVAGFESDYIHEKTSSTQLGYEKKWAQNSFNIDITDRVTKSEIRQSFRNNPSPTDGSSNRSHKSINPKFSGQIKSFVTTSYVIGADFEETDYDLILPNAYGTSTASDQQDNDSLFFQLIPQITDKLQFTFGMRKTDVKNDMKNGTAFPTGISTKDSVTVKELGLNYQIKSNLKFSIRYDENFRFAKVNELAQADATELLDTQTGESIELGIDWEFSGHKITASFYQLDLKNEIVFDPTVGPDYGYGPTGLNVNLDKTQRNGMTLSVLKQINQSISIKTDIGIVKAQYKSGLYSGNDISGVAETIAKIRVNYQPSQHINSYAELNYSGAKYAQGDNGNAFAKVDSINLLNIGSAYQIDDWNLHFRINNVSNKKYAEFVTNNGYGAAFQPSPERNFWFTAQYAF